MLEKLKLEEFDQVYEIMVDNFISDEYRNYEEQKDLLKNPLYKVYVVKERNEIITFIAIWEFDDFIYFEHLATKKEKHNLGIGTKVINYITKSESKNIVLEVEEPIDEIEKRRIEFYKRNGFVMNEYDYVQPPMSKGKNFVPLRIMSTKKINNKNEFETIKETLYKNVYKFTEK